MYLLTLTDVVRLVCIVQLQYTYVLVHYYCVLMASLKIAQLQLWSFISVSTPAGVPLWWNLQNLPAINNGLLLKYLSYSVLNYGVSIF